MDISNSSLLVSGGATLNLPGVTSYQGVRELRRITPRRSRPPAPAAAPALIHLSSVATSTTYGDSTTQFQAAAGGLVSLPLLAQIGGGATQL